MEHECSLQCSQEPVTDPFPEPGASSPQIHILDFQNMLQH